MPKISELWLQLRQHGLRHWLTVLVLTAIGFAIGHYINDHNIWIDARYAVSQKLLSSVAKLRGPLYPKRTALVFIGDDEYWSNELAGRSPLRRDYLAQLIEALDAADASIIAIDFDLRSPKRDGSLLEFSAYDAETKKLANSVNTIAARRPVILATTIGFAPDSDGYVENANAYETAVPTPGCGNGPAASRGYVQLPYDVRQVPMPLEADNLVSHRTGIVDSFSTAIVKCVDPTAYHRVTQLDSDELPFASYIAPEQFGNTEGDWRQLSAGEVLANPQAARKFVGGKIVIVSGNWNSRAYRVGPTVDLHGSPVGNIPGAMVHANYVEAMLGERTFPPVREWFLISIELLAVLFLAVVMALGLSPWLEAAAVIGVALFFLLLNFFLQDLGLFFDFFVPLVILLGHIGFEKINGWRKAAHAAGGHHA